MQVQLPLLQELSCIQAIHTSTRSVDQFCSDNGPSQDILYKQTYTNSQIIGQNSLKQHVRDYSSLYIFSSLINKTIVSSTILVDLVRLRRKQGGPKSISRLFTLMMNQ